MRVNVKLTALGLLWRLEILQMKKGVNLVVR